MVGIAAPLEVLPKNWGRFVDVTIKKKEEFNSSRLAFTSLKKHLNHFVNPYL